MCVCGWEHFPLCFDDTQCVLHTNSDNTDNDAAAVAAATTTIADCDDNDNIINLETFSDREPMP